MEFKLSSLLKVFGKESTEDSFATWLSNVGNSAERRLSHAIIACEQDTDSEQIQAYANDLHSKGVITTPNIHHTDAETLVGQYAGHTDLRTEQAIKSAKGGVLHIKDIYDLCENNDYGKTVLMLALIHIKSNANNDPVIVLSDNTDNIQKLLEQSPLLKKTFKIQPVRKNKQQAKQVVRRK